MDSSRPRTWSAFTAFQWYPQRISFAVAKLTARLVLRGVKASYARGRITGDRTLVDFLLVVLRLDFFCVLCGIDLSFLLLGVS